MQRLFISLTSLLVLLAVPARVPTPPPRLVVTLLYPHPNTEVEMGQGLKFIARVTDLQGRPVTDGQLTITVRADPNGQAISAIEATPDSEGTYRGGPWAIPHRIPEGTYPLSLVARRGAHGCAG